MIFFMVLFIWLLCPTLFWCLLTLCGLGLLADRSERGDRRVKR